jgi:hypothetical protein
VGPVDHQGVGVAASLADAEVQRGDRGGVGVVAQVEVAELGTEGAHELLAQTLVGVGAVLDDDDFVVEVVDVALVGARQRVQRGGGGAAAGVV